MFRDGVQIDVVQTAIMIVRNSAGFSWPLEHCYRKCRTRVVAFVHGRWQNVRCERPEKVTLRQDGLNIYIYICCRRKIEGHIGELQIDRYRSSAMRNGIKKLRTFRIRRQE